MRIIGVGGENAAFGGVEARGIAQERANLPLRRPPVAGSAVRPGHGLRCTAGAVLLAISAGPIEAAEKTKAASPDKSQYTLFNPTPDRLLRDLTTDRPDVTESPFTVDAGHVQIESNLFGYSRSRPDADDVVTDSYEVATTNIRLGLTNSTEVNVVWQPYGVVRTRPPAPTEATRSSGIGGVDIRGKINLWGNDNFEKPGDTAFGLLPFITLPTDRHNGISPEHVEGGIILPLAIKLTDKFGLGINTGVNAVKNEDASGYHSEWVGSVSLAYEWSENFGTYYEVAGRAGTRNPLGDIVQVNTGFTYKLNANLQLDAGINIGVTRAADRINPFVGITMRY